jgi:hypothetical protein
MAKAKTNKAQAIRDMLAANPDMPVKEIVSALAAKGQQVTANRVYYLRAKSKARKHRQQIRRKVATVAANADPVAVIRRVKEVAGEVGGLAKLKALVEALA